MALKNYEKEQGKKIGPKAPPTPTGIACTEPDCDGEMMHVSPKQPHPELLGLARAICGECGWKGWC